MSPLPKAAHGQRLAETLEAIRQFELRQQDWGFPELARAIGISPSQARALVATLVIKGRLEYREVTLRKMMPAIRLESADATQAA